MKILVTGANGFLGKNLISELNNRGFNEIFKVDMDTPLETLNEYVRSANFVYHLAGVNRPKDMAEFTHGNVDVTFNLLEKLKEYNNNCPFMISSSIQAELDNPYGNSKKAGEDLVFEYGKDTSAMVYVYRFSNLYGKWSKPNYNSVVATFCHKISRDEEVTVTDSEAKVNLCYIDDVVNELINCLYNNPTKEGNFCVVPEVDIITVGNLKKVLEKFKYSRLSLELPDFENRLEKNLYSTYLSFLPQEKFSYPIKMNIDERGSFSEFLKTTDRGQVSINVIKPGVTKGNHWHHTKTEKFLVVSGAGVIRFREINSEETLEYPVSGDKLEVVDIPVGFTHNIENLGTTDMVTVMWVNEIFNPEKPDTYYLEV